MSNNINQQIANQLELVASHHKLQRDKHRANAFLSASKIIRALDKEIVSAADLKGIKGIGPSTLACVQEYLNTGTMVRLQQAEKNNGPAKEIIDWLTQFHGIGPVEAARLYNDQGVKDIGTLWQAKLTDAQRIGVYWHEHIKLRIDRQEIDLIKTHLTSLFSVHSLVWEIAGSYRRGELTSGDIDIVIQKQPGVDMDFIVGLLKQYLVGKLSQGPTKYMGIFRLSDQYPAHRIDIRLIEPRSYYYALLYFTGSDQVNKLMRIRAQELGGTLSEYGIADSTDNFYSAQSEEHIFNMLGLAYLTPQERTRDVVTLQLV